MVTLTIITLLLLLEFSWSTYIVSERFIRKCSVRYSGTTIQRTSL